MSDVRAHVINIGMVINIRLLLLVFTIKPYITLFAHSLHVMLPLKPAVLDLKEHYMRLSVAEAFGELLPTTC